MVMYRVTVRGRAVLSVLFDVDNVQEGVPAVADACCAPEPAGGAHADAAEGPTRLWQVRELQMSAVAAALLGIAWAVDRAGGAGAVVVGLGAGGDRRRGFHRSSPARCATCGTTGSAWDADDDRRGRRRRSRPVRRGRAARHPSIAEGLEHYAVTCTRRGLRALLSLVPPTASVLRGGREITVAPDELVVGDILVLRPGERAATDGVIRTGRTSLDTSAITGESVPVEAGPGDTLHAGTINGGGAIEVEVTAPACLRD